MDFHFPIRACDPARTLALGPSIKLDFLANTHKSVRIFLYKVLGPGGTVCEVAAGRWPGFLAAPKFWATLALAVKVQSLA